jgi:hypothetical protein
MPTGLLRPETTFWTVSLLGPVFEGFAVAVGVATGLGVTLRVGDGDTVGEGVAVGMAVGDADGEVPLSVGEDAEDGEAPIEGLGLPVGALHAATNSATTSTAGKGGRGLRLEGISPTA